MEYIVWALTSIAIFIYISVLLEGSIVLPVIWHKSRFRREIIDTVISIVASIWFICMQIDLVFQGTTHCATIEIEVAWRLFDMLIGIVLYRNISIKRMFYCSEKARCYSNK